MTALDGLKEHVRDCSEQRQAIARSLSEIKLAQAEEAGARKERAQTQDRRLKATNIWIGCVGLALVVVQVALRHWGA